MESKSLKTSWIILFIVHIVVLINGLIWTFVPNVFLSSWFKSFMGQTWIDFVSNNASIASFINILIRYFGIMVIIIGFVAITVTLMAYKRGEKWSWYLALAGNVTGFCSSVVIAGIIGSISALVMNAVLLIVALVALVIGAKPILKKLA